MGNTIKIIQVIGDNQGVSNVDASIKIDSSKWNDLDHFEDRLNQFKLQNPSYRVEIENSKKLLLQRFGVVSQQAGSTGRKVEAMGLIWTGTTPDISDGLEKMGFKEFCDRQPIGFKCYSKFHYNTCTCQHQNGLKYPKKKR